MALPANRASGLPGNLVEPYRAGMTATADGFETIDRIRYVLAGKKNTVIASHHRVRPSPSLELFFIARIALSVGSLCLDAQESEASSTCSWGRRPPGTSRAIDDPWEQCNTSEPRAQLISFGFGTYLLRSVIDEKEIK
jgi:hypothetical protein